MDPISAINASINSSLRLFEVTYQLKAVDEQTSDLLSTTRHATNNVNEARRLRRLKAALLNNTERSWMDGIIDDAEKALRAIAELIEPARIDKSTKEGINFGHRVMWVFRDNPKVQDKHARLNVCHQSLMTVVSCLYAKDVVIMSPVGDDERVDQPPPYDPGIEDLMNWKIRRRRKSSMALSQAALGNPVADINLESSSTATLSPTSARSSLNPDRSSQTSGHHCDTSSPSQTNKTDPSESPSIPEIDSSPSTHSFIMPHTSYEGADGLQACEPYSPGLQPCNPYPQQTSTGGPPSVPFPLHSASSAVQPPTTRSYSEGEGARYLEPEDGLHNNRDRAQTLTGAGTLGGMARPGSSYYPVELPNAEGLKSLHSTVDGRGLSQQTASKRGRGRRNWLAYHATRSDMGHYTG